TPSSANLVAGGVTSTTFSDTGLSASTTFFYLVTAVNSGGESSPSNQASATTQSGGGGTSVGNTLFVLPGATQTITGSLSFSAGPGAVADAIPADNGTTFDGTPHNPLIYVIKGVSGTFSGGATQFNLFVDARTAVANGVQLQVLYDLNGSGTFGRTETYHYFATDNVVGFQSYTQSTGLESSSGSLGNLANGTIEIKVWNAIGTNPSFLNAGATSSQGSQSVIVLPFTNLTTSTGGGGGGGGGSTSGPVSINAGGAAAGAFVADTDFSGGRTSSTGPAINLALIPAPVPPQAVYQTGRAGVSTYTLGGFTPGTSHQVQLHFAEIVFTAPRQRAFNIVINGVTVLTNFDIIANAGAANKAIEENFTATANSNGQIVIQFTTGLTATPLINGIVVQ